MFGVTAYEPCDLHEITNCSVCSGLDKKLADAEREDFTPAGPFGPAVFLGKCPKCGEFIDVGALIYLTVDTHWICCP